MAWTTKPPVMRWRDRYAAVDVIVEMLDGWRRHISGRNASLLSFWGFLSIFPLLLVATTIVGLVLEGNEELQDEVIDSALTDIPILGAELASNPAAINGSVTVLVLGLIGALWSGSRAFVGAQLAFDDVWEVPIDDRSAMPVQRLRALVGMAIIGTAHLVSLALTALVHSAGLPGVTRILLVLLSTAVHVMVIAAMYRYLTSAQPSWRDVWPGAIGAGIVYSVLQHYAAALVRLITDGASDTYGQFAVVLGLVTWLGLLAMATIMGAELNAALRHRRGATNPPGLSDLPDES